MVSDFDQVRALLDELGVDPTTLRTVGRLHLVKTNRLWSVWRRLRASVDVSGFWPVILGSIEDHPVLDEVPDDDEVDDAIAQGLTVDPDEQLAVAEDQYWYCPDVVDQGVETVDALAIAQVASRRWFFWWD